MTVSRDFFERGTLTVARELIGCRLVSRLGGAVTSGVIVETEAYLGRTDKAAHSYKGRTERVRALYGQKGAAYIYLIYGMYWCLNISTGPACEPECVLLRALEPESGMDAMAERRFLGKRPIASAKKRLYSLCSGPGKLTRALAVTGEVYGVDLCDPASPLTVEPPEAGRSFEIVTSKRIGVDYAEEARDFLYRFTAKDSPYLSRPVDLARRDI